VRVPPGFVALLVAAAAGVASATPPPIMGRAADAVAPAASPAGLLRVQGLDGKAVTLSAADIAATTPRLHIGLSHMGRMSDYAGPQLIDILQRVDAPFGPRLHGRAAAIAVLVTASDGYHAVLSLGEIDPQIRPNARVILADQEDGRPLPPNEAPYRLVIEGDGRAVRDVHSVVSIDLRPLP
jgi:hypothetical protein